MFSCLYVSNWFLCLHDRNRLEGIKLKWLFSLTNSIRYGFRVNPQNIELLTTKKYFWNMISKLKMHYKGNCFE